MRSSIRRLNAWDRLEVSFAKAAFDQNLEYTVRIHNDIYDQGQR